jgi:dihydroorotase-like cyclic amidohydrolase
MNNVSSNQPEFPTVCIQGGTVIDPGHVNGRADVLIQNGKIVEVGYPLKHSVNQDDSVDRKSVV